jgi:Enterochelin esterase and related enzymes
MHLAGTLHFLTIHSEILQNNPLGDPSVRACPVYLPPDYQQSKHYPLLVDLAPYTNSGLGRVSWRNFGKSIPQYIDDLITTGKMPPVIVAFPDCFTRLGGNQYINSAGIGHYADYIMQEVVPYLENLYACGGPGRRGVYGKSSGGYAALMYGLRYADFWSAIACHSGDIGFELAYLYDMPQALMTLSKYNDIRHFIESFEQLSAQGGGLTGAMIHTLMMCAMAATYDPSPDKADYLGIRLPVDLKTMELIPERWHNWLGHDPLELAKTQGQNLKKLKALYIDCGRFDQYRLLFGARRFKNLLEQDAIPHTYEEFDGTHSNIDYRLQSSLPLLVQALV